MIDSVFHGGQVIEEPPANDRKVIPFPKPAPKAVGYVHGTLYDDGTAMLALAGDKDDRKTLITSLWARHLEALAEDSNE
jgi:hypothetical protein